MLHCYVFVKGRHAEESGFAGRNVEKRSRMIKVWVGWVAI